MLRVDNSRSHVNAVESLAYPLTHWLISQRPPPIVSHVMQLLAHANKMITERYFILPMYMIFVHNAPTGMYHSQRWGKLEWTHYTTSLPAEESSTKRQFSSIYYTVLQHIHDHIYYNNVNYIVGAPYNNTIITFTSALVLDVCIPGITGKAVGVITG